VAVNITDPEPLSSVPGVTLASGAAAIKSPDRDDLALILLAAGSSVAGVFTHSSFRAAPVMVAREHLALGGARALLINSGNANAATGPEGVEDARRLCREAADALHIDPRSVLPFSTGVIGQRLPVERMLGPVRDLAGGLTEDGWLKAAKAIMTTDTVAKAISVTERVGGTQVTITGIAKGAGMIRPDMATMLAFVCTDAAVSDDCLAALVKEVADGSFNRITVDGDTSTNDSFVVAATNQANHRPLTDPDSPEARSLAEGLLIVSRCLAQACVRDAEGATKFVTIEVSGGRNEAECLRVAWTVAESPLVKTALFAEDPNWGRLAMAIGRAGVEDLDVAGVAVWFDAVQVMANGVMAPNYTEEAGARVMAQDELCIRIDLGRGDAHTEVWTSDLSYEYVRINAEYRT
jgi:glutamate N-acetyltransferase/amino-acid N-acetyltransferase